MIEDHAKKLDKEDYIKSVITFVFVVIGELIISIGMYRILGWMSIVFGIVLVSLTMVSVRRFIGGLDIPSKLRVNGSLITVVIIVVLMVAYVILV
jgi:hypothetical protein